MLKLFYKNYINKDNNLSLFDFIFFYIKILFKKTNLINKRFNYFENLAEIFILLTIYIVVVIFILGFIFVTYFLMDKIMLENELILFIVIVSVIAIKSFGSEYLNLTIFHYISISSEEKRLINKEYDIIKNYINNERFHNNFYYVKILMDKLNDSLDIRLHEYLKLINTLNKIKIEQFINLELINYISFVEKKEIENYLKKYNIN